MNKKNVSRNNGEQSDKNKLSKQRINKSKVTQSYSTSEKQKPRKVQAQPNTSWAEYKEPVDLGKDFESLANVPITSDRFVPKSEKHWSVNISHFSELFSLDSALLSLAIGCIPLNEFIEIEDNLFTPNQIREINNTVAKSKSMYNNRIDMDELSISDSTVENQCETISTVKAEDDVLDFLLTLKEPVKPKQVSVPRISSLIDGMSEQSKGTTSKSTDLEEWLDSILNE